MGTPPVQLLGRLCCDQGVGIPDFPRAVPGARRGRGWGGPCLEKREQSLSLGSTAPATPLPVSPRWLTSPRQSSVPLLMNWFPNNISDGTPSSCDTSWLTLHGTQSEKHCPRRPRPPHAQGQHRNGRRLPWGGVQRAVGGRVGAAVAGHSPCQGAGGSVSQQPEARAGRGCGMGSG